MRIKELYIRTAKPDQTKENNLLEDTVQRAGFIKKKGNHIFYTPLGLLLRHKIEEKISGFLQEEGFVEGHISKSASVSSMGFNIDRVHHALASSYKDLPIKLYFKENIDFTLENHSSLWQNLNQKVIVVSFVGLLGKSLEEYLKESLELFIKGVVIDEGVYFYPLETGNEYFRTVSGGEELQKEVKNYPKEERKSLETPGMKTVKAVCEGLSIEEDDLLKTMIYTDGEKDYGIIIPGSKDVDLDKVTRVLGIESGRISAKEESEIEKQLLISPGYIGPVGLKVHQLLIDHQVIKEKPYVVGANRENQHITGVIYGRDYKGDFHHLVKENKEEPGWVLGEVRDELPMLRVQNAASSLDYFSQNLGYINLDRLFLAICHQAMDKYGFHLPKNLGWFDVVVTAVDQRDDGALEEAERVYEILLEAGFNAIFDDRKDRLGSKFRDYDLISIPYRVILGKNYRAGFDLKNKQGEVVVVNQTNLVFKLKEVMLDVKGQFIKDMEEKDETI